MKNRNQKGFTLIEIIVVVGILAVLTITALIAFNPSYQFQKARDAQRKSDLSQISKALENYNGDYGSYPSNTASYQITGVPWGTPWTVAGKNVTYMTLVPKDPSSSRKYIYYVTSDGQSYYLYASLERDSDPKICAGGQCTAPSGSGLNMSNACGGKCNYGVTSPDVSP